MKVKVAVGARGAGFRRLPVPRATPTWENPALMVRRLVPEAVLGPGQPTDRATDATAVVAGAQAGLAARAMASALAARRPMIPVQAKVVPSCRGKDRGEDWVRVAIEPGLTVALKMTGGTVRAQMRSPTR